MRISKEFSGFLLDRRDNVALLTFSRPEIRNPLSISVIESLRIALERLEENDGLTHLVFTGTGKTFASGADLREVVRLDRSTAYEFAKRGQDLMRAITRSRLGTIAAVNGFCIGGALDLALACDRRIASTDASFAHPGVSLGIITGWGGTQMLPKLVGFKNAYDMFLTAKRIDANEALRIGLIDEVADDPVMKAFEFGRREG